MAELRNIVGCDCLEKKARFIKQKYHKTGSRAQKPLALRLRKPQAKSTEFEIKDPKTKKVCHKLEDVQHILEKEPKYNYPTEN